MSRPHGGVTGTSPAPVSSRPGVTTTPAGVVWTNTPETVPDGRRKSLSSEIRGSVQGPVCPDLT